MKAAIKKITNLATKPARMRRFQALKDEGLPEPIVSAVSFLLSGGGRVEEVISSVESARQDIAKRGSQPVEILYSPKPGSSGSQSTPAIRPEPGSSLNFTMERVARTGKDKTWGSVLYILARESRAEIVLELGTCAGMSAAYLASSEYCKELHTIEGSAALSGLARETLKKVTNKAHVYNDLFDDALDKLLPELPRVDCAFIDGHHEKVATIHYWERIAPKMRPGGVVIFDDISWSQDMRDGWIHLSRQPQFSHAADLGSIGVCICGDDDGREPRYWDLQSVLGKKKVGKPHGWSKQAGELVE